VASNQKVDSVYVAILKEYAADTAFVTRFEKAQKLWNLTKHADIDARFPSRSNDEPITVYYGQVVVDCMSSIVIEMNEQRLRYLNQWLRGIPEGDVCIGSIKMNK